MESTAICTINYCSKTDTVNLLNNLNKLNGNFEVYILENGSSKNKITNKDLPKTKYKKHFFISKKNLGFAGGCNLLIKKAIKNKNFNYFWLLNNDTTPTKNSLTELLNTFILHKSCGIAGSVVVNNNNNIWWGGSTLNLKKGFILKKYFGQSLNNVNKKIIKTVEVNGAVMLIKKEVIKKIGFLDTVFFHTAEDTDYSIRAKNAGFDLYVNFNSIVKHSIGRSSGGAYSPMHMYYVERGRIMLMKKWGYLNFYNTLQTLPLLIKRVLAPTIKKGNIKASVYCLKGIFEGFVKKV